MLKTKNEDRVMNAVSYLPTRMRDEIIRKGSARRIGLSGVREIRIRLGGLCTMLIGSECVRLLSSVDKASMQRMLDGLLDGALYAHRDSIAEGFVSIGGGVRVGICGHARYEGERLVGVSDISSLLFRIPTGECAFADELYSAYLEARGGMLIYSPPGVGKTTALRLLAERLGRERVRVAVIDERCEFDEQDYAGLSVDILKGYRRPEGIEIATRTLSPEIIMIDELGKGDSEPVSRVIRCGIPLIATAHAGSLEELRSRVALSPILSSGAFSRFVGIFCESGEYRLAID